MDEKIKEVDLFLVGKTGYGKSETGNTILDHQRFACSSDGLPKTLNIDSGDVYFKNFHLRVIDTPGLASSMDVKAPKMSVVKRAQEIERFIQPTGCHLFLLIMRFGVRLTQEEYNCIMVLKEIFGSDFIEHFGIILMTHGDQFAKQVPDFSFKDWCRNQEGYFKQLFCECKERIILWDNVNMQAREDQLGTLIKTIAELMKSEQTYTRRNFEMAKLQRISKNPCLNQELQSICIDIEEIEQSKLEDSYEKYRLLLDRMDNMLFTISNGSNEVKSMSRDIQEHLVNRMENVLQWGLKKGNAKNETSSTQDDDSVKATKLSVDYETLDEMLENRRKSIQERCAQERQEILDSVKSSAPKKNRFFSKSKTKSASLMESVKLRIDAINRKEEEMLMEIEMQRKGIVSDGEFLTIATFTDGHEDNV